MQLGKLHVSQELQELIYKTAPIRAQCDQRVTSETQNLERSLSITWRLLYADICGCDTPEKLDLVSRSVSDFYARGLLTDDEATELQLHVQNRRPQNLRRAPSLACATLEVMRGRLSRFRPRQHPRSPDRKASRERRRRLGGSSALPDRLRHHYTEGQRSVLCIVAGEIKRHGICDFPIDKIAALAGVCRTTVQTTMHESARLGRIRITPRPRPGRKSLTNIVEIISTEWKTWIKRGPSPARQIGSNPAKIASPTKNIDFKTKGAFRKEGGGVSTGRRSDIATDDTDP